MVVEEEGRLMALVEERESEMESGPTVQGDGVDDAAALQREAGTQFRSFSISFIEKLSKIRQRSIIKSRPDRWATAARSGRPTRVRRRERIHCAAAGVLHDTDREQERGDDEQGADILCEQTERGEEVGPAEGGVHAALQLEGQVRTLIPHEKKRENTPEPKRATTMTLGAFKLREEKKKETGIGSWFAKKKSEDSGIVTKATAGSSSRAVRSEQTSAAMALKEYESQEDRTCSAARSGRRRRTWGPGTGATWWTKAPAPTSSAPSSSTG